MTSVRVSPSALGSGVESTIVRICYVYIDVSEESMVICWYSEHARNRQASLGRFEQVRWPLLVSVRETVGTLRLTFGDEEVLRTQ